MKTWIRAFFNKKNKVLNLDECHYMLQVETYYKKLAIDTCIGLIANALARCEVQTFQKGKKFRGNMYYLLNVQPNKNQNATWFFHKVIRKYIYDNECLIIMQDGELFVADTFDRVESAFRPNMYKNITLGDLQMSKVFFEEDVIYLRLTDEDIIKVIDNLYESFGKLLASSMNYYRRKNNKRLLIRGDFLRPQDGDHVARGCRQV